MKKYLDRCLTLLEHHKHHFIEVNVFGKQYKLCARCTGQIAFIPSFFICALIYFLGFTFDFMTIFMISWVLAGLTIIDWSSVEIFKIRKGNNTTRMLTGATLGIGTSMYMWLLPETWFFRMSTMTFYSAVMAFFILVVFCKKNNIQPIKEIKHFYSNFYDILANPKRLYCGCSVCPCLGTGCCSSCCGGSSCCTCLLCGCTCILVPFICALIPKAGKQGSCCGTSLCKIGKDGTKK